MTFLEREYSWVHLPETKEETMSGVVKPPVKICKDTKEELVTTIQEELAESGHLDPALAKNLKELASDDAEFHENHDPDFTWGGGRANG